MDGIRCSAESIYQPKQKKEEKLICKGEKKTILDVRIKKWNSQRRDLWPQRIALSLEAGDERLRSRFLWLGLWTNDEKGFVRKWISTNIITMLPFRLSPAFVSVGLELKPKVCDLANI